MDPHTPLSTLFADPVPTTDRESRLQRWFCQMVAIRQCEARLLELFNAGLVRGTVHTCLGQEACAVGVVSALDRRHDIVCSNHRGHGHYLATNGDVRGLVAEIMGRPSGVCGGVGGSQHLHRGNFYTNGILGGMPPVATGMAAAEMRLGSGRVVCVFLGDGAMAEGGLYEALNMAGLWKLPIVFAVEHNQYAQSTHWAAQHAGSLPARAGSFGVPVIEVDGNEVEAVHQATRDIVRRLRGGEGPGDALHAHLPPRRAQQGRRSARRRRAAGTPGRRAPGAAALADRRQLGGRCRAACQAAGRCHRR